ncbi:AHH domain-containing protein [Acidithiobacillus sp.]
MRKTIGLLIVCMAGFTSQAQAGLLGFVVGSMVEHHIEKQQADNGDNTVITDHPIAGAVAGGVAGAAAEGMAVHEVQAHPFLAITGGAMAATAADDAGRDYLEKHGCSSDHPPYWSCPGIPGQHVLPVEAKDLYILDNRSDAKELAENMTVAGDPRPGSGCAAHHIVPSNERRSFAQPFVNQAKNILKACGIDINNAINGVWLPQNKTSECVGSYHPKIHSQSYYKNVASRLYRAYMSSRNEAERCNAVKNEIGQIKADLLNGAMP